MPKGNAERALAKAILHQHGRAGGVPPEIRAAARRVLDGAPRGGDASALRAYWGVARSGAGALRGASRGVRGVGQTYQRYTAGFERLQNAEARGGSTTGAVAGLVDSAVSDLSGALRSKGVRDAVNSASGYLANSGIGRALGIGANTGNVLRLGALRNLKMLGAYVQIAALAKDAVDQIGQGHENEQRVNKAEMRMFGMSRTLGIDPGTVRQEREMAELRQGQSRGILDKTYLLANKVGKIFGTSDITGQAAKESEALEKSLSTRLKTVIKYRNSRSYNSQDAYARSGGLGYLTEQERADIDDAHWRKFTNPERFRDDPRVKQGMDRYVWEHRHSLGMMALVPFKGANMIGRDLESERQRLMQQAVDDEAKYWEHKEKDRHEMVEQHRRNRSMQQRIENRRMQELTARQVQADDSRHEAWRVD